MAKTTRVVRDGHAGLFQGVKMAWPYLLLAIFSGVAGAFAVFAAIAQYVQKQSFGSLIWAIQAAAMVVVCLLTVKGAAWFG
jgi:hypothetical protein